MSVWEDESIALDALANDYFAGNNASIIEFSKVRYAGCQMATSSLDA